MEINIPYCPLKAGMVTEKNFIHWTVSPEHSVRAYSVIPPATEVFERVHCSCRATFNLPPYVYGHFFSEDQSRGCRVWLSGSFQPYLERIKELLLEKQFILPLE